ncbi:glycine betaine ABC transporter substrate-binding protein [Roseovarius salis]|uniref:glycine betaine ABC transporter substrate-binding protein n=1 Tax=Roseovarius salis TaxID=3376063 RepID=UPI0037CC0FE3
MVRIFLLSLCLLVAACGRETVVVGSKDFDENRILAEMFALLLEEEGLRVERRIPLGSTSEVFESLRQGSIDVYPEYTGTALGLLGQAGTTDAGAAWRRVQFAFHELGLKFLPRLGFESTYAVLVTAETATARELETIGDLGPVAQELRLGATEAYVQRPRDGLQPMLGFFGLDFSDIVVADGNDRAQLYTDLVEGRIDVMVGYATDPEIRDFGLVTLVPTETFFPPYEAAPLVSEAALARAPSIEATLTRLADKLDVSLMRRLNEQVGIEGRSPARIARDALAELGLVEPGQTETVPPFAIAAETGAVGGDEASLALRSVRQAVPRRGVAFLETVDPIAAISLRSARIALVPSISHFHVRNGRAIRNERIETVAVVGSSLVHALTLQSGPNALAEAQRIAVGPFGTASYRLGRLVAASMEPEPDLVFAEDASAGSAAALVRDGSADAAIVVGALGRPDLRKVLTGSEPLVLADAAGWWSGITRLRLPFLRRALVPADTYGVGHREVDTLAMQLTLTGPARPSTSVIGRQGPGSYIEELYPLTDNVVRAINANLDLKVSVDPSLKKSDALQPSVRPRRGDLNPEPERSVLSVAIVLFVIWAGWLLVRPKRES